MSLGLEEGLLLDLARWDFGALLAKRAKWEGVDPQRLTVEVRAYRLAILRDLLPKPLFFERDFVLRAAFEGFAGPESWACCQDWEGRNAAQLPGHLLERLRRLAPLGEAEAALQRFAQGKAFKYGLRVGYLVRKFEGMNLEP